MSKNTIIVYLLVLFKFSNILLGAHGYRNNKFEAYIHGTKTMLLAGGVKNTVTCPIHNNCTNTTPIPLQDEFKHKDNGIRG
jgi:hypothetical protein